MTLTLKVKLKLLYSRWKSCLENADRAQLFIVFSLVSWMMEQQVSFELYDDIQVTKPASLFEGKLGFKIIMMDHGTY